MRTLFRGARVVLPTGVVAQHVLVENGVILDVDASASATADEVVEAAGKLLLPGVVDDQVHFREPGLTHKEDLYTASRACAKGGVTTFLEMPNTSPTTTSQAQLEAKLALASYKSLVNYGFYIGATPQNVGELRHAHRTPGIKIFIGSSTGDLLVDAQDALERIFAETTLPITAHCEDEAVITQNRARLGDLHDVRQHSQLRDNQAAIVATRRAVDLALRHRHRFHVLHVSTADEVDFLDNLDHQGLITAEACVHHFLFDTTDYPRLGTLVQMNPSLKSPADRAAIWQGLHDGALQVIATDHAPHTLQEKAQPYPRSPSGLPAVENSLALVAHRALTGLCTWNQLVHWMCDAPARVWGLVGKGRIANGYDADLVLFDPDGQHTIDNARQQTRCGWSPWHGTTLLGQIEGTWVGGHRVYTAPPADAAPDQDGIHTDRRGREATFDHRLGGYWATPQGTGPRA